MAFEILKGILAIIGFVAGTIWVSILIGATISYGITKWFKEREEYVKRMSLIQDHEYEKVH